MKACIMWAARGRRPDVRRLAASLAAPPSGKPGPAWSAASSCDIPAERRARLARRVGCICAALSGRPLGVAPPTTHRLTCPRPRCLPCRPSLLKLEDSVPHQMFQLHNYPHASPPCAKSIHVGRPRC